MENSIFHFLKHQIYFLLSCEMLISIITEAMFLPTGDMKSSSYCRCKPCPQLLGTYANDCLNPNVTSWLPAVGEPLVKDGNLSPGRWEPVESGRIVGITLAIAV